jgi:hypothetical protein
MKYKFQKGEKNMKSKSSARGLLSWADWILLFEEIKIYFIN